jgi:hypothetical protein
MVTVRRGRRLGPFSTLVLLATGSCSPCGCPCRSGESPRSRPNRSGQTTQSKAGNSEVRSSAFSLGPFLTLILTLHCRVLPGSEGKPVPILHRFPPGTTAGNTR